MQYITMCTTNHCPHKNMCYRSTKIDIKNPYQTYTDLSYQCCVESGFDLFIPITNKGSIKN